MEVLIAVKAKDMETPQRTPKQFLIDQINYEQQRLERLATIIQTEDEENQYFTPQVNIRSREILQKKESRATSQNADVVAE